MGVFTRCNEMVVGSYPEKLFYFGLYTVCLGMFALTTYGNVMDFVGNKITSVDIVYRTEFEMPVIYFCFPEKAKADSERSYQTDSSYAQSNDLVTCDVEGNLELFMWEERDQSGNDMTVQSSKCLSVGVPAEEGSWTDKYSDLAESLTKGWQGLMGDPDMLCYTVNEDGNLKADSEKLNLLKFNMDVKPDHGAKNRVVVGFVDPSLVALGDVSFPTIMKASQKASFMTMYNSETFFYLQYDKITDLSDELFLNTPTADAADGTANSYHLYTASSSSLPSSLKGHSHPQINWGGNYVDENGQPMYHGDWAAEYEWGNFEVVFQIDSFVGREVLIRRMTITELWSAIGGAWSTSLMLMVFFFVGTTYARKDGSTVQAQVLRIRNKETRDEFIKSCADVAKEEAVNKLDTGIDVEMKGGN